jgi:hypothetical protein
MKLDSSVSVHCGVGSASGCDCRYGRRGKRGIRLGMCMLEVGSSVSTVTGLGTEISVCATRRNFPLKVQNTERLLMNRAQTGAEGPTGFF